MRRPGAASSISWQQGVWQFDTQHSLVWRIVSPRRFAGLLLADLQQAAVDLPQQVGAPRGASEQSGDALRLLLRSALLQAQAVEMASTGLAGRLALVRRLLDYAIAAALACSQRHQEDLAARYFLAFFELLAIHGQELVPQEIQNELLGRYCALALAPARPKEHVPAVDTAAEALGDPGRVAWQVEMASYESTRIRRRWIAQVEALGQANPALARALAAQVRALSPGQPEVRYILADALEAAARSGRAPATWRERPVVRPQQSAAAGPHAPAPAAGMAAAEPVPSGGGGLRRAAGGYLRTWWSYAAPAMAALISYTVYARRFPARAAPRLATIVDGWVRHGARLPRAASASVPALVRAGTRMRSALLRLPALLAGAAEWRRVVALGISAVIVIALTVYPEMRARMSRPDAGQADQAAATASAPAATAVPGAAPPQSTQVPITRQTVLTAAEGPYLVRGMVTIGLGMELRIEPGTVVTFAPGASLRIDGGRLRAIGSATQPILFTSMYDPAGGAARDRSERAPQPGDWGCLCITAAGGAPGVAELSYVVLRYGGGPGPAGEQPAMLLVQDSVLSLQNSAVSDSAAAGVALLGSSLATIVESRFGDQVRGANAGPDVLYDQQVQLVERDNSWQPPQRRS